MDALLLVLLALLVLAARAFQVRHRLAAWQSLWHFRHGPITVELRRHAHLARLDADSLDYPLPREFRVLSLRVGGIPVWSQQAIVGLPAQVEARIDSVPAGEFDHLFERQFRLGGAHRPARLFVRAH